MTYNELYENVSILVQQFKKLGIKRGDTIAGFIPNMPQAIIAMLAAASIGATWSSCSPDFGVKGVIERFSQINPKILFITDQYFYNGKKINIIDRLPEILKAIPSIKNVLVINYPGKSFVGYKKK